MAFRLEKRPYGPNSTPEELQALRERISVLEPGIILWHEIPVQCYFSAKLMEARLMELVDQQGTCGIILDLIDAEPPSGDTREDAIATLKRVLARAKRVVFLTGKSFLVNAAAKFILGTAFGFGRVGLQKTREDAIQDLRDALGKP